MVSTRFEVNSNPPMRYPRSIFFIISNEFSERFNYYGMRTVLALYLTQQLAYSNDTATVIYHVFTSLVYFFPLMGAILADSWLGKFKTILYLSIVYCAGSALIALGAIPPLHLPATSITVLGLLFIAIGSGGIKPCVSAFGGDQFKLPEQAVQLAKFFSLFYFAINAGSLISTTLTPILREDVHCFGQDNCFALAFGVPAALMIFSIVVFVCGRAMYTINKPSGNMIVLVFKAIRNALTVRSKERTVNPREHWLDYAEPKYGKGIVADIKSLMKILILYIPLPVFWALFDQQGSRWTFQATRMDGEFAGYTIKPDQIQVINPLLILAFIPLFESFVYPALAKIGIRRPLQKLSFGGILAGAAFVLSGFVEIALDRTNAMLPAHHEAQMRIFNGLPCDFRFHTDATNLTSFSVPSRGVFEALHLEPLANYTEFKYRAETSEIGCVRENASEISGSFRLRMGQAVGYYLTSNNGGKIEVLEYEDTAEKDRNGVPRVRLLANVKTAKYAMLRHISNSEIHYNMSLNRHDQMTLANGEYEVYVGDRLISTVKLNVGGVYTLLLDEVLENEFNLQKHTITPSNSVHMLWLVPQYVVITAGEVMFSITGLEFSYSQAPESMKSVIQAFWLLTVAIGNMLVVFIAEAKFVQSQSLEFFLFAVLMFLDMGLFMVLAVRYHYSQDGAIESIEVETTGKKDPLPGSNGSDTLSEKGSARATGGTTYANEAFRED
ncbi:peptide transporter family 1-like [Anopheles albimanus]|uniref:Oligopeptide transporter 1 n=1 Tax=Anopheles albimanus TaxID=7167 RepID=A0A182FVA2_ANOAL|nr:peptide transporter family 1-like [Anopheles albimanus]XP_035784868.1 peptide transporter family 1-like [Anopheles albimanus]XP_035784869.1 peptide transporter family 1-like [Anopheles albimanus]XP_035784870.1 peptide transporter family 1-like [Anopheles albimanus]XP_035784871.1 peptide transporter family 1-like [Anopheles albimanus]XP_035784872.1 peptide transporter family 1-like [Anopheles albimanus]